MLCPFNFGRFSARVTQRLCWKHVRRQYAITGNPKADETIEQLTGGRAGRMLRWYEDFVGLTEVREAQQKVIEAEIRFLSLQSSRHESQMKMTDIQSRLKHLRTQLMQVHRGDERFIPLVTEEDGVIKEENDLKAELNGFEKQERNTFAELSAAVRESHEKERSRTERTKYWSVVGSLVGVVLGIIGTSVNNYRRMKELRGLVKDSTAGGLEMRTLVTQLAQTITDQQSHISHFIADLKNASSSTTSATPAQKDDHKISKEDKLVFDEKNLEKLMVHAKEILEHVKKQEDLISSEMSDVKHLLGMEGAKRTEGNVVYVGPEIRSVLADSEQSLERKIKMNTLWSVTFVYAGFALTLPILYSIFKGAS